MALTRENVSFRTVDGLVLRGWLYPAASVGPSIIITPGLPCVKEMFVPQVAEAFQSAGISALVYDPRNLGDSDGQPRNEIDPAKQVSDYSDALTFLLTQRNVDPDRVAFWGMSFSATIALCAASLDKRAKCCIAACPYLDLRPPSKMITQVLAKCMRDRESRGMGNPPTYLPMLTATGKNPAGLHLHPTPEELELVLTAQQRGAANFENRSTLETYYNFITWCPEEILRQLPQPPILFMIPEQDTWSPPERQRALFETFDCPKQMHNVPNKGHLTLFNSEDFSSLMQIQVDFMGHYMKSS
ncbi:MAG: hypothetical protein M1828_005997 [Chrysothrix sp. TS-e1954]|nr:MAG: hypothetical protein M1828_005997 [Chrysothrix sp. TS-e1954]